MFTNSGDQTRNEFRSQFTEQKEKVNSKKKGLLAQYRDMQHNQENMDIEIKKERKSISPSRPLDHLREERAKAGLFKNIFRDPPKPNFSSFKDYPRDKSHSPMRVNFKSDFQIDEDFNKRLNFGNPQPQTSFSQKNLRTGYPFNVTNNMQFVDRSNFQKKANSPLNSNNNNLSENFQGYKFGVSGNKFPVNSTKQNHQRIRSITPDSIPNFNISQSFYERKKQEGFNSQVDNLQRDLDRMLSSNKFI